MKALGSHLDVSFVSEWLFACPVFLCLLGIGVGRRADSVQLLLGFCFWSMCLHHRVGQGQYCSFGGGGRVQPPSLASTSTVSSRPAAEGSVAFTSAGRSCGLPVLLSVRERPPPKKVRAGTCGSVLFGPFGMTNGLFKINKQTYIPNSIVSSFQFSANSTLHAC